MKNRRSVLRALSGGVLAGIAGCSTNVEFRTPRAQPTKTANGRPRDDEVPYESKTRPEPTPRLPEMPVEEPLEMKPIDALNGDYLDDDVDSTRPIERKVHKRLNDERETQGWDSLTYDPDLAYVARWYSRDLNRREELRHVDWRGWGPPDRVRAFGLKYTAVGENLAGDSTGVRTDTVDELVQSIFDGWMNSKSHRENMLYPSWYYGGVGIHIAEDEEVVAGLLLGAGRPDIEQRDQS